MYSGIYTATLDHCYVIFASFKGLFSPWGGGVLPMFNILDVSPKWVNFINENLSTSGSVSVFRDEPLHG